MFLNTLPLFIHHHHPQKTAPNPHIFDHNVEEAVDVMNKYFHFGMICLDFILIVVLHFYLSNTPNFNFLNTIVIIGGATVGPGGLGPLNISKYTYIYYYSRNYKYIASAYICHFLCYVQARVRVLSGPCIS